MAKLVVHAYTQDKNNPTLKTAQELLTTVGNSLGGFIAWIDLVDETNATAFEYEDKLEEE